MDQRYEDKLDGKIEEAFWNRKMQEWREQEQSLEYRIEALKPPLGASHSLDVKRILDLANKACSL
jgi:hypothetical protein